GGLGYRKFLEKDRWHRRKERDEMLYGQLAERDEAMRKAREERAAFFDKIQPAHNEADLVAQNSKSDYDSDGDQDGDAKGGRRGNYNNARGGG
ncbi:hypothetical protein GUF51_19570, partial [Xanthomonas citri pv. citri]|nr:hypothetical protein [Xanthomonas citri pv. citri]